MKGFGVGIASVAVPLYVFDVLVAPHRSLAIGWATVFSVFGQAITFAFSVLLRETLKDPADAFHYTWIAEIFWGVLIFVTSFFLPESPKFLARRGEWIKATSSLEKLASQKNISLISVPLEPSRFGELFSKEVRTRFFFVVAIQLFARATCVFGITHITHYTLTFCRLDNITVESMYGAFFAIQFIFTMLSIFIMKNARKKDMLAYGFFLLTIAFTCLGTTSFVYATLSTSLIAYAPMLQVNLIPASSVLALTAFSFSVASLLITSLSLLYTLEALPCASRSKGVSIAISTAWTVETFAASMSVGLANVDPFLFFFVLAVISFIAIFITVAVYENKYAIDGLPFPLDILENSGDPEEKNETVLGANAAELLINNAVQSEKSSGSDSLHEKSFQPQNFISIHKRSDEPVSELPQFVVQLPEHMATGKSGTTELQMKTADTRFPLKTESEMQQKTGGKERFVIGTDGDRLVPYRTHDSKVTISGLWSEVSDQEF